jgi:hypothetical protein
LFWVVRLGNIPQYDGHGEGAIPVRQTRKESESGMFSLSEREKTGADGNEVLPGLSRANVDAIILNGDRITSVGETGVDCEILPLSVTVHDGLDNKGPKTNNEGRSVRKRANALDQLDGHDDDDDEDDDDDGDDGLGSDLDEESDEDEDQEMQDLILCQYEKVNRIKNKWKCVFRDGIIHVDGKDYLFNKATTEFDW